MNPYLIIGLQMSAKIFAEEVEGFKPAGYDSRPDPDRFSMREAVAHMSDWEPIFMERLKVIVNTPAATIPAYDESKRCIEQNYGAKDPKEEVKRFLELREKTVEFLKGLSKEQLKLSGIHPERGELTIMDMAHTIICHDLYHVEQLRSMKTAMEVVDTW
jgi:hypothetical protein